MFCNRCILMKNSTESYLPKRCNEFTQCASAQTFTEEDKSDESNQIIQVANTVYYYDPWFHKITQLKQ